MLGTVLAFLVGHSGTIGTIGVAILDLVFAINPQAQSNGFLHWMFIQLGLLKPPS